MDLIIKVDNLSSPEIAKFLEEHITEMKAVSPPESKHALDLDGLKRPEITFWTVWHQTNLVGSGAIRELNPRHGEIKSMRTSTFKRGKGIASKLLVHILEEALQRGYSHLSLETGSMPFFEPARRLYRKFGFQICLPFAEYTEDPNSVFMTIDLSKIPKNVQRHLSSC